MSSIYNPASAENLLSPQFSSHIYLLPLRGVGPYLVCERDGDVEWGSPKPFVRVQIHVVPREEKRNDVLVAILRGGCRNR